MMIYRSLSAGVCSRFDQGEETSNIFIYGRQSDHLEAQVKQLSIYL